MLSPNYSDILKSNRTKFLSTKKQHGLSLMLGFLWRCILTIFSPKWYSGHAAFSNWNRRRWLRVLFARCSEWSFGEYYFQENFEDFKKAQSKKVVIPKNTVSCSSRCFWVSRRLVSFLESSEQISRFGAAFKKPPPKRRFLVHQQGLEPGTRWLRVSCSPKWQALRVVFILILLFQDAVFSAFYSDFSFPPTIMLDGISVFSIASPRR